MAYTKTLGISSTWGLRWAEISEHFIRTYKERYAQYFFIFLGYTGINLFSSYMFHIAGTQPAVILAPQGIALAAALIYGYTVIPATALGTILVAVYAGTPAPLTLLALLANVVQPALTLYILGEFNISRSLQEAWDFYAYIGIAFLTCTIVPTVNTIGREFYNSAAATPVEPLIWSYLWVSGLVSGLILTPFLVRLFRPLRRFTTRERIENFSALLILNILTAVLTYTPTTAVLGINLILPFCLILMWIALRGGTFFVTLAMITVTISAISGRIMGHPANPEHLALPEAIVAAQTSIIVFALLFYFIASLEESRRTATQRLRSYTAGLERTVSQNELDAKAKNEFIAMLGHEIRNPLASLLASVELLKVRGENNVEQDKVVDSMEKRIHSMNRLLDDIFDISRITRKKIVLKREVVEARVVLQHAIESVELSISEHRQRFFVTLPEADILVDVDTTRIEQVVANLLHNATKYTPSGGSIEVLSEFEEHLGGDMLVIRVKDTGIGLSVEEQARIFEPFIQINPEQSLTGGIGLGLTVARNLVEMHGGTLGVMSEGIGRGSEFIVRIPARRGVLAPQRTLHEPMHSAVTHLGNHGILVVDDNVDAAEGMCKLLRLHGYEAEAAYSGAEVLTRIQSESRPRVVVLDIGLPDMDGYEVAQRVRKHKNPPTLIALSGYGPDVHGKNTKDAGFDHYLTKPVSVKELIKVIDKGAVKM